MGWVACGGISFCDDSPFAYIFSGARVLAATFGCRCWGERAIKYFHFTCGDMTGADLMNKASTAGLPGAYT